jgi:hypothetical protein
MQQRYEGLAIADESGLIVWEVGSNNTHPSPQRQSFSSGSKD